MGGLEFGNEKRGGFFCYLFGEGGVLVGFSFEGRRRRAGLS